MTPLYLELNRWMGQKFEYGVLDCMLAPCDWVLRVTGRDPAENLRGTYHTLLECDEVTGFLKNPIKVTQACCESVGLELTRDPQKGDIGVVMHPTGAVGAVCLGGKRWASKAQTGVTIWEPEKLYRAWSVGYED